MDFHRGLLIYKNSAPSKSRCFLYTNVWLLKLFPAQPIYDTELFETILSRGDVKAIVTGHDHNNTYVYNYQGIKLCSAPTISKLGYSKSELYEGSRFFDLNAEKLDDIFTYINYVVGRPDSALVDNFVSNAIIESFDGTAPSTGVSGFELTDLSGELTLNVVDGVGKGGTEWQTLKHGGDGCFGAGDGSSVEGKKGYFAFAIEDYLLRSTAAITRETVITGFYMYLDINNSTTYSNVPFYIDNIMFVEDYTTVTDDTGVNN